ncbi:hypothetical protein GCM10007052_29770 [Halioglobus japonicus]|uniref:DUF3604 domain-containing protein n=1 Tax=Halioglobus japonicus TaxID=930805 RepID=A0AAP8MHN0_9GAMM|nr:DUF3604 domain-containing protein [Halioglobus japonicus]PLW87987.1 hypothetical protein C0029_05345 [Halioglobus japonicus]GHD20358.1 hypothetical protein GCM10007052_29770 [Halioglobus japonicus]
MKRIVLGVLGVIVLAATWLWHTWDQLSLQPTASEWQPSAAAAAAQQPQPRESCRNNNPLRQPFFGDVHVHTSVSFDARSRDMLGDVDSAYRFARGMRVQLAPYDAAAEDARFAQLPTALDFAAVTDHAEWVGEVFACSQPEHPAYTSEACRAYRQRPESNPGSDGPSVGGEDADRFRNIMGFGDRNTAICGPDNQWCRDALKQAWEINQAVTEAHYDRSADCEFTTFHGYEYSNSVSMSKVHRNILFRNEIVPELPVSSLEEPDVVRLWEKMDTLCNQTDGGCEAISIPHNPNVSSGRMFYVPYRDEPLSEQQRLASLRARMEPVVEMMQIKGESECRPGMWNVVGEDEWCDFEKIRGLDWQAPEDCEDGYSAGAIIGVNCQSRLDFARYALLEGVAEEARIGVNPYRFGMAGSTDTHNALPGAVSEQDYPGCCGEGDATTLSRLNNAPGFAGKPVTYRNPGGLMGVWAEENSRDSLFDAMQRREVFATSGPRIVPRLFAGWDLPASICDSSQAEAGYAGGVPMGAVLPATAKQDSPLFVASAVADPRSYPLQRLQVIKLWRGADDAFHQAVFDIAGGDNDASVDLDSCATTGRGHAEFCETWRDPDFDPAQPAVYYTRVLENPSCRWSWQQCLSLPESERPEACSDPGLPKIIQERAWTSPIWYQGASEE